MVTAQLRPLSLVVGLAFCVALSAVPATAEVVELIDGNTKVQIDPESPAGMYTWQVGNADGANGVDHMAQQWFWFRVADNPEQSIDSLSLDSALQLTPGYVKLTYSHPDFRLEVQYIVTGGAPGDGYSDIAEIIRIKNTSDEELDLHFFQYCDMDLAFTADNDTVWIADGSVLNTAVQEDEFAAVSETAAAWAPDRVEAGEVDPQVGESILDRLNDGNPTDLTGNLMAGPGNVAWAFQWDFEIMPGDSRIFSKNKVVAPEPAAASMLAIGGILVLARRRRRKS